ATSCSISWRMRGTLHCGPRFFGLQTTGFIFRTSHWVGLPVCARLRDAGFSSGTAHFFAGAEQRPWRFIAAISALALLSAHGVMLALGLTASRAWYSFRSWKEIPVDARKQLLGATLVFCIVIAFVARVNWPPSDRYFARFDRPANENFGLSVLPAVISNAFFGSLAPSIAFLLAVGGWCACRRRFLPLALPTAFLLLLFAKVYANFWHCGASWQMHRQLAALTTTASPYNPIFGRAYWATSRMASQSGDRRHRTASTR